MKTKKRKQYILMIVIVLIILLSYFIEISRKTGSAESENHFGATELLDSDNRVETPENENQAKLPEGENRSETPDSINQIKLPDKTCNIFMKDSKTGWAILMDGSLLETKDEWKTYRLLKKFAWNEQEASISSLTYADNTIFVTGILTENQSFGIYSSEDNGDTWNINSIDYFDEDDGANQLFCSFIDKNNGYVLFCSGPALGLMKKVLYKTTDGGITFQKVEDISDIKGYPTGLSFNEDGDGFITCTYHGDDNAYLYGSYDQGKTWEALNVQPSDDLIDTSSTGYFNGYPPRFTEESGFMVIEYVTKQPFYSIYHSSDSGKTWSLDGKIDLQSDTIDTVVDYSFCDDKMVYIVDSTGKLLKKVKDGNEWK